MMAEKQTVIKVDDDEWLDWETRHPHVPMWKHMIAGKIKMVVDLLKAHALASLNTSACSRSTQ